MNRRNQILAVLLVVQIIVAAIVLVLPAQASNRTLRPLMAEVAAADVTALTIQEKPDRRVRMAKKDGQWVLPEIEDFPVNETKVNELLDKLVAVQVGQPVATTATSHARLQVGEDAFARRVDLTTNKGDRTMFFGPARGGSSHVRLGGSNDVFLTTKLATFDIPGDLSSWINTIYFTSTEAAVGQVAITNITGTLQFQRNVSDVWEFKGLAAGETFNPSRLETILSRVSSLYMIRPLGKTAKPEYSMDRPTATITLTLKSDLSSLAPLVLTIGAKQEADNAYVVKSRSSPWYVLVNAFILDEIVNARREDFIQPPATPTPEATATPAP
ncbi:MAG: DUF4340 domain-containing protein [Anaerolineae bacterium]|nr:DUF4340 domain-containing protein [Candidatus Roseilinea sp.]MDW8449679.1 DUF4340 domain-containing protein [Anaerolineae bacterium]